MGETMIESFKEFAFEAAHQLPPFSGLHGHTFKVTIFLKGEPDPEFGWSHNLYEVDEAVTVVKRQLDHRYLNEIEGLSAPSLENVARWIWDRLDRSLEGLDRIVVRRGVDGDAEGCTYSGRLAGGAA